VVTKTLTNQTQGKTVTAACPSGKIAVGGGGKSGDGSSMVASYPSNITNGVASSWTAEFASTDNAHSAYVICAN
jgi:hypothetical protein